MPCPSTRPQRRPRLAMRHASVLILGAVGLAANGCAPERLRPGPPNLVLELPQGNTVFSPDTIEIRVHARDDNGLDSVTITILGQTEEVFAFDKLQVDDILAWLIPDSLPPGEVIEITGYAKDLVGERTVVPASVTVVARPAAAR